MAATPNISARLRLALGLWALLIGALYLLYLNAVPDFRPDQEHDAFTYISFAKAIGRGEIYASKHWMPGFPVFLSFLISTFGINFVALKLFMIASSFLAFSATYEFARRCIPEGSTVDAALIALLAATNPLLFDYSHRLMSEVPSVALCMTSLAIASAIRQRRPGSLLALTTALICTSVLAVLTRGNALALVPAFLAAAWSTRRDFRVATALAVAGLAMLITFVGWGVRNNGHRFTGIHNVTYLEEIRAKDVSTLWAAGGYREGVEKAGPVDLARRIYRNGAWSLSYGVADAIVPGARQLSDVKLPALGIGVALVLCVPIAFGIGSLSRTSIEAVVYLAGTMLLALAYPTGGSPRMLIPSLPVLIVCAYSGMRIMLGVRGVQVWAAASAVVTTVACIVAGDAQARQPYSYPGFRDFLHGLRLAEQYVPVGEPIVSPHGLVVDALTDFDGEWTENGYSVTRLQRNRVYLLDDGRLASLFHRDEWCAEVLWRSGLYSWRYLTRGRCGTEPSDPSIPATQEPARE